MLIVAVAAASCGSRPPSGAEVATSAAAETTTDDASPAPSTPATGTLLGDSLAQTGDVTPAAPLAQAAGVTGAPLAQNGDVTPGAPLAQAAGMPGAVPLLPSGAIPTMSILSYTDPSLEGATTEVVEPERIQAPNPVTIHIPRIGVRAPIIPLGLRGDGKIAVPEIPGEAGWWLGGPEPGEPGPAVILGHVDSTEGPAVFYHLRALTPGDEIVIDRADGSALTYIVEASERHPKDDFPTDEVYGPTEEPTLRLVTCGGDYDFDVRSYPDNVIVFASLV